MRVLVKYYKTLFNIFIMQLTIKNLTNLMLLLVLLVSWWFTATVIHPELHYFLQQSAFLTNSLFFKGFTTYPGGIADYISEFIAQFFYFNTWGSLLILLVASLQGIIAIQLVERVGGKVKMNFSLFALILLLAILVQCNYHYPFYAGIRLLFTFAFAWIFTVTALKFPRWRYFLSFLLAIILFYLAGGAALLTFALSIVLIHIRFFGKKADLLLLPLFALFSGILPYLAYKYIFLVDLSLVYSITHSKAPLILYYIPDIKLITLYSILPVYLLGAILYNHFKNKPKKAFAKTIQAKPAKGKTKGIDKNIHKNSGNSPVIKAESPISKISDSPLFWVLGQFTVMTVLAIGAVNFTFDKTTRDKILVSFYGANGDWDQVIKTAESLKEYDLFVNFEYNKAHANRGKLADNLFNYKQLAGAYGLFMDAKVMSEVPFICSDQYYDLGFMYESQKWAFEAQTIFPNSPRLMKRLVQINLVNGKYKLAEKFLDRLDENMLYRDWVAEHQKFIDDTSLVSQDPVFSRKRKCEPGEAFTATSHHLKLMNLLEANPANQLALDYLLCSTLLEGDLATFKALMNENKGLVKTPLPRSWDEALVLFHYMARKAPPTDDFQFSKDKRVQFASFIKDIKPYGNDWQQAGHSLQKEYGTTYWYYIKCQSPKVTKVHISQQKADD